MEVTKDFTGALLVKEFGIKSYFLMVFDDGILEYHENFGAKNFEKAEKYAKEILENEDYEDKELVIDEEGTFELLIGKIIDNERITFKLSDFDDDDYDGSIESYLSDPNHWD